MRIAAGIIGIFLAIIILVQAAAAGTANAIGDSIGGKTDSGGSWGFFVALLFVVGSALLIGHVWKGAIGVWAAAAVFAFAGAATSTFSDLWVWAVVAVVYFLGSWRGYSKRERPVVDVQPAVPTVT
jgi:hypothetical protein